MRIISEVYLLSYKPRDNAVGSRQSKRSPFTKFSFGAKMASLSGRLAQRIERLLHTQEVTGSNPVLPTIAIIRFPTPYVSPPSSGRRDSLFGTACW